VFRWIRTHGFSKAQHVSKKWKHRRERRIGNLVFDRFNSEHEVVDFVERDGIPVRLTFLNDNNSLMTYTSYIRTSMISIRTRNSCQTQSTRRRRIMYNRIQRSYTNPNLCAERRLTSASRLTIIRVPRDPARHTIARDRIVYGRPMTTDSPGTFFFFVLLDEDRKNIMCADRNDDPEYIYIYTREGYIVLDRRVWRTRRTCPGILNLSIYLFIQSTHCRGRLFYRRPSTDRPISAGR